MTIANSIVVDQRERCGAGFLDNFRGHCVVRCQGTCTALFGDLLDPSANTPDEVESLSLLSQWMSVGQADVKNRDFDRDPSAFYENLRELGQIPVNIYASSPPRVSHTPRQTRCLLLTLLEALNPILQRHKVPTSKVSIEKRAHSNSIDSEFASSPPARTFIPGPANAFNAACRKQGTNLSSR